MINLVNHYTSNNHNTYTPQAYWEFAHKNLSNNRNDYKPQDCWTVAHKNIASRKKIKSASQITGVSNKNLVSKNKLETVSQIKKFIKTGLKTKNFSKKPQSSDLYPHKVGVSVGVKPVSVWFSELRTLTTINQKTTVQKDFRQAPAAKKPVQKQNLLGKIARSSVDVKKKSILFKFRPANKNPAVKKNIKNHFQLQTDFFKSKPLLCWTSELAFLNLRAYFLNLIKAMHLVWCVAKNNGSIVLINHGGPLDSTAHLSAVKGLVKHQIQRTFLPRITLPAHGEKKLLSLQKHFKHHHTPRKLKASKKTLKNTTKFSVSKPFLKDLNLFLTTGFSNLKTHAAEPETKSNSNAVDFVKPLQNALTLKKIQLNSRLCTRAYGDTVTTTMGFFSNSNAVFKDFFNPLNIFSERGVAFETLPYPHEVEVTKAVNQRLVALPSKAEKNSRPQSKRVHEALMGSNSQDFKTVLGARKVFSLESHFESYRGNPQLSTRYEADVNVKKRRLKLAPSQFFKPKFNPKQQFNLKNKPNFKSNVVSELQFDSKFKQHHVVKMHLNDYCNRFYASSSKLGKPKVNASKFSGFGRRAKTLKPLRNFTATLKFKPSFAPAVLGYPRFKKILGYEKKFLHALNSYDSALFANHEQTHLRFANNAHKSQANIIVFSHPEKAFGLVNQARNLQIPTVGLLTGGVNKNPINVKLDFPIIGNSENQNFVTLILRNFIWLAYKAYLGKPHKKIFNPKTFSERFQLVEQIEKTQTQGIQKFKKPQPGVKTVKPAKPLKPDSYPHAYPNVIGVTMIGYNRGKAEFKKKTQKVESGVKTFKSIKPLKPRSLKLTPNEIGGKNGGKNAAYKEKAQNQKKSNRQNKKTF